MKTFRRNIASTNGKLLSGILLILLLLNNILIPEMERFHPASEIENNSANILEIIVEHALGSELYQTDEHDDSSDNLVDTIQKFLSLNLTFELKRNNGNTCDNESIYPKFRLTKGYTNLDTPPPQFL